MLTQAEVWSTLKLSFYSVMFASTEDREKWPEEYREWHAQRWPRGYWEWHAQCEAAVSPVVWWEPIVHDHRGRHVRITRGDFPDTSSVVATETWYKVEADDCARGTEYAYFLTWSALPIQ